MKLRMEDFLGRQGDFKPDPRIRALDRRGGVNEDLEDAERQRFAAVDNRQARRIPAATGKPGTFAGFGGCSEAAPFDPPDLQACRFHARTP